jgi:hypothetical protein
MYRRERNVGHDNCVPHEGTKYTKNGHRDGGHLTNAVVVVSSPALLCFESSWCAPWQRQC